MEKELTIYVSFRSLLSFVMASVLTVSTNQELSRASQALISLDGSIRHAYPPGVRSLVQHSRVIYRISVHPRDVAGVKDQLVMVEQLECCLVVG